MAKRTSNSGIYAGACPQGPMAGTSDPRNQQLPGSERSTAKPSGTCSKAGKNGSPMTAALPAFLLAPDLDPSTNLEPADVFCALGTLIVEGRQPAKDGSGLTGRRGYTEGPHVELPGRKSRHKCSEEDYLCKKNENLRKHMLLLWQNNVPLAIEVLLCSGSRTSSGPCEVEVTTTLPEPGSILLEQWTVSVGAGLPAHVRTRDQLSNTLSLLQAVRSYLHFSQLSAWYSRTGGSQPNNVLVRITIPGEEFATKFCRAPEEHFFPVAGILNNHQSAGTQLCVATVSVRSLPRTEIIPQVPNLGDGAAAHPGDFTPTTDPDFGYQHLENKANPQEPGDLSLLDPLQDTEAAPWDPLIGASSMPGHSFHEVDKQSPHASHQPPNPPPPYPYQPHQFHQSQHLLPSNWGTVHQQQDLRRTLAKAKLAADSTHFTGITGGESISKASNATNPSHGATFPSSCAGQLQPSTSTSPPGDACASGGRLLKSDSMDSMLGDSLLDPPQSLSKMTPKRYQSPSRSGSPSLEAPEHLLTGSRYGHHHYLFSGSNSGAGGHQTQSLGYDLMGFGAPRDHTRDSSFASSCNSPFAFRDPLLDCRVNRQDAMRRRDINPLYLGLHPRLLHSHRLTLPPKSVSSTVATASTTTSSSNKISTSFANDHHQASTTSSARRSSSSLLPPVGRPMVPPMYRNPQATVTSLGMAAGNMPMDNCQQPMPRPVLPMTDQLPIRCTKSGKHNCQFDEDLDDSQVSPAMIHHGLNYGSPLGAVANQQQPLDIVTSSNYHNLIAGQSTSSASSASSSPTGDNYQQSELGAKSKGWSSRQIRSSSTPYYRDSSLASISPEEQGNDAAEPRRSPSNNVSSTSGYGSSESSFNTALAGHNSLSKGKMAQPHQHYGNFSAWSRTSPPLPSFESVNPGHNQENVSSASAMSSSSAQEAAIGHSYPMQRPLQPGPVDDKKPDKLCKCSPRSGFPCHLCSLYWPYSSDRNLSSSEIDSVLASLKPYNASPIPSASQHSPLSRNTSPLPYKRKDKQKHRDDCGGFSVFDHDQTPESGLEEGFIPLKYRHFVQQPHSSLQTYRAELDHATSRSSTPKYSDKKMPDKSCDNDLGSPISFIPKTSRSVKKGVNDDHDEYFQPPPYPNLDDARDVGVEFSSCSSSSSSNTLSSTPISPPALPSNNTAAEHLLMLAHACQEEDNAKKSQLPHQRSVRSLQKEAREDKPEECRMKFDANLMGELCHQLESKCLISRANQPTSVYKKSSQSAVRSRSLSDCKKLLNKSLGAFYLSREGSVPTEAKDGYTAEDMHDEIDLVKESIGIRDGQSRRECETEYAQKSFENEDSSYEAEEDEDEADWDETLTSGLNKGHQNKGEKRRNSTSSSYGENDGKEDVDDDFKDDCVDVKRLNNNKCVPVSVVSAVPSANKKAAFRKSFDSATSMVFHRSGLPLTSSPAPMRRAGGAKFDFDSGIATPKDIRQALFSATAAASNKLMSLNNGQTFGDIASAERSFEQRSGLHDRVDGDNENVDDMCTESGNNSINNSSCCSAKNNVEGQLLLGQSIESEESQSECGSPKKKKRDPRRLLSTSAPAAIPNPATSNNNLLGNFEESVLNGRLEPVSTVEGFTAEIGASGSFHPKHLTLPVTVFFYTLCENSNIASSSPYLGHINLGKKGYRVPEKGTIQITLFNPLGTVVKMFVVMYDLSDMPPNSQTFLRQRTLYMPPDELDSHEDARKWLRYLIHIRLTSSKSGKIYLHTDVRMIIFRKSDMDTATDLDSGKGYELRSFTRGPTDPKFSPRR